MEAAKQGDTVTVFYEGMLENEEVFESSNESGPFEFTLGEGTAMPGFEQAITGMQVGEFKKIMMEPENAYGEYKKELVHTVKRSSWSKDVDIKTGVVVGMTMEQDGQQHQVPAMVTAISGDDVTVDFNHPLAGKKVIYSITLQKINGQGGLPPCQAGGCSSTS